MSQESEKKYRTNVQLSFPPAQSGAPLVCNLTRLFDIDFNISTASISPRQEGFLILELSGSEEACEQGVAYLREKGITVSLVSQRIWHNEETCMQCGMCTALCPTAALSVDTTTRLLAFDKKKCIVCGRCLKVCPVGSLQMDTQAEELNEGIDSRSGC